MEAILTTFSNALVMLAYVLPGFLLGKFRRASGEHLPTVSALLVYLTMPMLIVHSFLSPELTTSLLPKVALFFGVTLVVQLAFILGFYALFHRRMEDVRYRVFTVASALGNVGFFGLPIVQGLFPDHPEVLCYSAIYSVTLNIVAFTAGEYCLTREKKYVRPRAALLNPCSLAFAAGLILFATDARSVLPAVVTDAVGLVGRMSTPLSMLALGIRLAGMRLCDVFGRRDVYAICAAKLFLFPLVVYLLTLPIPMDPWMRASFLVLSGSPCATITYNLTELHGCGEDVSASCLVLTMILSVVTVPLLCFLI